ncbi:XRE family transcriptional regulator [Brevibacillus humidisoli]|uniref:helix-turn-helix domain-containing protein n=1 Tax=Brevibacillus humidisoli TaxID=2895522 RepID=UPI001E507E02|nr:XRE family transcriptional regulator [Brevibacillus humidisoli]UFJ41911.1 XRE family transcriptional regulator [Brevibacillus humidisoli]
MRLPIEAIGQKIRTIRKEKGYTLEILAVKTGLSKGLLSQVERGISQPSLDSLWKITRALEASLVHFFEDVDQKHVHLIRRKDRRQLLFPHSSGMYSLLATGGKAKLGMMQVRLMPGEQTRDQFVQAEGEECLFVMKGKISVYVGDDVFQLEPEDSLYFDSSQPHVVANEGEEEAVILWALTPPQF